jgi:hypothetical protein
MIFHEIREDGKRLNPNFDKFKLASKRLFISAELRKKSTLQLTDGIVASGGHIVN